MSEPAAAVPPVFTQQSLPGGPWRSYRPRATVTAVRMSGPFAVENPDGSVTDVVDGWLVVADGVACGMEAAAFSEQYEAERG